MKIISKHKDYYDFFISEPDPTRIWLRNPSTVSSSEIKKKKTRDRFSYRSIENILDKLGYKIVKCYFCGTIYVSVFKDGIYFNSFDSLPEVDADYISKYYSYNKHWKDEINDFWRPNEDVEDINRLNDSPVIIYNENEFYLNRYTINAILTDTPFRKLISPKDAYLKIYDWIAPKEPEMPNSPTDIHRFESKGFDKKTSFRKPKP